MSSNRRTVVVSFSGGKDSTATALLALQEPNANVRLVFADTGNEHEETLAYVHDYIPARLGRPVETVRADFSADIERKRRYVVEKWPAKGAPPEAVERALRVLVPTGNPFLDLCLMKGRFPARLAQFCTQRLKRWPMDAYMVERLREGGPLESWQGVRRDESRNRAGYADREWAPEGWEVVRPIAGWTADQVVAFVQSHGVELNPLYRQGMNRVGCMPCINCGKDELAAIAARFPRHIDRIREWEQLVSEASRRGWTTFFTDSFEEGETHAEIFDRMRIDRRVAWARTTRGGKQFSLLKVEASDGCSSSYGLCE